MVPVPVNGAGNLLVTLTRISLCSSERQEALSEKGPVMHYQLITCAARRKTYSCRVVKTAYFIASWIDTVVPYALARWCRCVVRTHTNDDSEQSIYLKYCSIHARAIYPNARDEFVSSSALRTCPNRGTSVCVCERERLFSMLYTESGLKEYGCHLDFDPESVLDTYNSRSNDVT